MLIEYIDGTLEENDKLLIEAELKSNEEAKLLYNQLQEVMMRMSDSTQLTPGEALKNSFDHFLKQEIAKKTEAKTVSMIPMFYRIAAGLILLMVVGVTAYWIRRDMQNQEALEAMKKELEANKRIMMAFLENEYSPSQRMQGVSVAYEMSKPDDEIVEVLVKTLNTDPNTNVRLAALDALSKFNHEAGVRKSLVESLGTQKDPLVQIALIQLLVEIKEKGALKQLERVAKDVHSIKEVKAEAYSGIFKLS